MKGQNAFPLNERFVVENSSSDFSRKDLDLDDEGVTPRYREMWEARELAEHRLEIAGFIAGGGAHVAAVDGLPKPSRLPQRRPFGTKPRGLRTRCLRFVITVARVLLYDHARLASDVVVPSSSVGLSPLGHSSKFQIATSFLFDQRTLERRLSSTPPSSSRFETTRRGRSTVAALSLIHI